MNDLQIVRSLAERYSEIANLDIQKERIERSVDKLLADPEVDLIITLGYLGTNYVCHKGNLPKPVVASIVGDARLQNLPLKEGASGIKNLSYIDSFVSFLST